MIRSSSQHLLGVAEPPRLGPVALEQAMRAADPAAVLAPPRILRRVIKQSSQLGGIGLRVPHRKTFVIQREQLLAIVERSELDLPSGAPLAEKVILLARPTPEQLGAMTAAQALNKYWRLLFHARVHLAFDELLEEGKLNAATIGQRVDEIGHGEFAEIQSVLRQDDYLLPPRSQQGAYIEFAAVYLELRYFAPGFLKAYFPSIEEFARVDAILALDIDPEEIFQATRPTGAEEPEWPREGADESAPGARAEGRRNQPVRLEENVYRKLIGRAARAATVGNLVRAAILRTRAARYAEVDQSRAARADARTDLQRLALRLQSALGFNDAETEEWSKALVSLLDQASRGVWSAEARVLYDLQKVCVDHERGIYSLDFFHWSISFARTPLKRWLPGQRDVLMSKHLRSAAGRLAAARLSGRARVRITAVLHAAMHRAEANLRSRFRPLIDQALDEVQLLPRNLPERVARAKLVEELLDRVVDRGFLSMGDLRDALSSNNLKLPDLTNFRELLFGDQLLRANWRLARTLDGVYRRGEVYLTFPQRLSSLAFGTPGGRFLTRYVAIPFGGAFLTVEFVKHLIALVYWALGGKAHVEQPPVGGEFTDPAGAVAAHHGTIINAPTIAAVVLLGFFLLGLLHHRRFRLACLDALLWSGHALRWLFVDLPLELLRLPIVKAIVNSVYFKVFKRYFFKPILISAGVALTLRVFGWVVTPAGFVALFVGVNALLNSRLGRDVDELLTDWVVQGWHLIRIHIVAAVFRAIMDVFNRILQTIERLLYAVDEWLRFRTGERHLTTVAKVVLGTIWMVVNYVIRFCVNLVIEPQINPIKHFPVVTVSHKLILTLLIALGPWLVQFVGVAYANFISFAVQLVIPGVFGFLVWELKANWKLYAANRPEILRPVLIGHHAETLLQFMKPGFRSGTLPKLYAKLRKASRKAFWTSAWRAVGKQREALHRVEEHVRRFVDRDLLRLLEGSKGWDAGQLTTGEIHLGTNRILVELYCPDLDENSLWLAFEQEADWLMARVYDRGWLDRLGAPQKQTLGNALAGFYKMAGVDLVREQLAAGLDPRQAAYEILESGLKVPSLNGHGDALYPLRDWTPTPDHLLPPDAALQAAQRQRLVFAATPIAWCKWVVIWELDQLRGVSKQKIVEGLTLLPGAAP